jgi:transcriptional regulator with PAS, ATPase and Fis domain/CHASE2 domain-containing sensor protein
LELSFSLNKYRLTAILLVLITCAGLAVFPDAQKSINYSAAGILKSIVGEKNPSGDIVIIHITSEDLQNLGGSWPLKRSYYALLINRLNKLNAGVIGFEIFLSPLSNSQTIYNETLLAEIKKMKTKIVFSSLLENAHNSGRKIYADSTVYPFPKYELADISTGHLNYYDDYGFYIPAHTSLKRGSEDPFLGAILKKYNGAGIRGEAIKVNIGSSWKKFKNYSFIEFIKFSETEEAVKEFSGKIVLFGVSDPQIAKTFSAPFNKELPGIALHAFAISNYVMGNHINEDYKFISAILFAICAAGIVFANKKRPLYYAAGIISFIIASFLLLYFLNIELNYSFFIIPVFALAVHNSILYYADHKKKIRTFESESAKMREELAVKRSALNRLQSELDLSPEEGQTEILKKISELKSEISILKEAEEDKEPIETKEIQAAANFHGILYKNRKMAAVIDLVKKVAPENASVLIYGESGAGKELFARALHELSPRRERNFVAVNCAALSETLLESELFGHVKGAFTNAVSDKTGRFEAADKGTIFLDEIGETSENFQTKLLRILQSGTFEKVGSSKTISVDVRVVAATNKKLEDLIAEKKFREDLYYRLNVIKLDIPPLRERKDDIELLVQAFLPNGLKLSKSVLERFLLYDWKGNVRELESAVKRAAILAKADDRTIIQLKDIPQEVVGMKKDILYERVIESLREKKFSHSSMTDTARELEIGRTAVSENFRGYVLKTFYENNYDVNKTVLSVSQSDNNDVNERVKGKIDTILENLSSDINKSGIKDKDEFKKNFPAKYKNMPQYFHFFQDEAVRHMLSSSK